MTNGYGLQDKVVIITGGAAGIGRATAKRFAEEGARVSIWDMNTEAGAVTLAELKQLDTPVMFQAVNVVDAEAVEKAVAEVVETWGHIDVLVNNAGITRDGQLVKYKEGIVTGTMSDASFDAVIGVNLKGVFVATRAVVPHMIKQGQLGGRSVRQLRPDQLRCHQGRAHRHDKNLVSRVGQVRDTRERCCPWVHHDGYGCCNAGEGPGRNGRPHARRTHRDS
jgi:NAD(P)-dependent dehydrogenase (short-subunit alcohol dehydrogenase family)